MSTNDTRRRIAARRHGYCPLCQDEGIAKEITSLSHAHFSFAHETYDKLSRRAAMDRIVWFDMAEPLPSYREFSASLVAADPATRVAEVGPAITAGVVPPAALSTAAVTERSDRGQYSGQVVWSTPHGPKAENIRADFIPGETDDLAIDRAFSEVVDLMRRTPDLASTNTFQITWHTGRNPRRTPHEIASLIAREIEFDLNDAQQIAQDLAEEVNHHGLAAVIQSYGLDGPPAITAPDPEPQAHPPGPCASSMCEGCQEHKAIYGKVVSDAVYNGLIEQLDAAAIWAGKPELSADLAEAFAGYAAAGSPAPQPAELPAAAPTAPVVPTIRIHG